MISIRTSLNKLSKLTKPALAATRLLSTATDPEKLAIGYNFGEYQIVFLTCIAS